MLNLLVCGNLKSGS